MLVDDFELPVPEFAGEGGQIGEAAIGVGLRLELGERVRAGGDDVGAESGVARGLGVEGRVADHEGRLRPGPELLEDMTGEARVGLGPRGVEAAKDTGEAVVPAGEAGGAAGGGTFRVGMDGGLETGVVELVEEVVHPR